MILLNEILKINCRKNQCKDSSNFNKISSKLLLPCTYAQRNLYLTLVAYKSTNSITNLFHHSKCSFHSFQKKIRLEKFITLVTYKKTHSPVTNLKQYIHFSSFEIFLLPQLKKSLFNFSKKIHCPVTNLKIYTPFIDQKISI